MHQPLSVLVIARMQQTKPYQGSSRNEINNPNTEYATFRTRAIANTGWLQKFIAKDDLKPGNLYQSRDILHHHFLNPDMALSFSVCCVGVIEAFGRFWIYLSAGKYCD